MEEAQESALRRVTAIGPRSAAMRDLLAVAIARSESDIGQAEGYASALMGPKGQVRPLADLDTARLQELGMGPEEALRSLCWLEIGRRAGIAGKGTPEAITGPADVAALLHELTREKKEHFVAILLDAKNVVLRRATVHIGTLTMSVVSAREVFREAVREGAAAMIVAHNHPSGDPTPSPEDFEVTTKLADAGRLLDIPLLDHVILGENSVVSLHERGFIHG